MHCILPKLFAFFLPLMPCVPGALLDASDAQAFEAGTRWIGAPSRERRGDLDVTVWYPARAGGEPVLLGETTFFLGSAAMRGAPIAEGTFPLILLSHGAGLAGYPEAAAWIAAPLAQQGFVVAAPTHPGNSGKDRSAAETMKIWLRSADLSETLNAMGQDPIFKDHIDEDKVGVLGLSMGGTTALAMAGARIDTKLLASYCDTATLNPSLCEWVSLSGVDLHGMDLREAGRDNRDTRIAFAMAIDPAPVDVFDFGSFAEISIPVDIVNLGRAGEIPKTADASRITKTIVAGNYATIPDASHYSMFAECKPGAAESTEAAQIGDPICMDDGGRPRSDIHTQLIEMTVTAFSRGLKINQRGDSSRLR